MRTRVLGVISAKFKWKVKHRFNSQGALPLEQATKEAMDSLSLGVLKAGHVLGRQMHAIRITGPRTTG